LRLELRPPARTLLLQACFPIGKPRQATAQSSQAEDGLVALFAALVTTGATRQ
jgi:hypothetical protein